MKIENTNTSEDSARTGAVRDPPPDWTSKYPEEFRQLVAVMGIEDKGKRILEAFNEDLIEVARVCRGGPRFVWKEAYGSLHQDWSAVLERHEVKAPGTPPSGRRNVLIKPRDGGSELARHCAERTHVDVSDGTLVRLRRYGRGPARVHAAYLARWRWLRSPLTLPTWAGRSSK
jgi:hypothetical protein